MARTMQARNRILYSAICPIVEQMEGRCILFIPLPVRKSYVYVEINYSDYVFIAIDITKNCVKPRFLSRFITPPCRLINTVFCDFLNVYE